MTTTPFTPTQDKTRTTEAPSIDALNGSDTIGSIPRNGNQPNSGPRRTANIARVRESRTISDICADATFAAQTAALKKWQARERGRELTLKIAAMLQANVARLEVAEPVKEVLKDYQPDFGDRDEVVRAIQERGYATPEEVLYLRQTTTWILKPMSPSMQATKARVGG